jgi:ATP-binding cassette subfamily F protein 3
MLVSHDRALLRAVCDEFWLVGRGVVAPFDGDLDDYQRYLLDESKRLREEAKPVKEITPVAIKKEAAHVLPTGTSGQKLKKNLQTIEEQIAQLQAEQAVLQAQLVKKLAPAEIAAATKRLKVVDTGLAQAEEQWMGLSEQLEAQAS